MKSSEESEAEEPAHPVDRGWAWVVLAGCTINFTLVVGVMKAFGIYFVEFITTYQASASLTSLIAGLLQAFYSLTSLPIMTFVLYHISSRQTAAIGGLLAAVSYMIGSFAPNAQLLLLSNGVLFGIAFGCTHGPSAYLIGLYFLKHRSLANAILVAGGSFGGLCLPPIYRYLLDTYQLRGALLITAGILLHTLIGAALMRPPNFYKRKQKRNPLKHCHKQLKSGDKENNCEQSEILLQSKQETYTKKSNFENGIVHTSNGSLNKNHLKEFSISAKNFDNIKELKLNGSHDNIPVSHAFAANRLRREEMHGSSRSIIERKIAALNGSRGSVTGRGRVSENRGSARSIATKDKHEQSVLNNNVVHKISLSNLSYYASHGDLYTSSLLELSEQQADIDIGKSSQDRKSAKTSCSESLRTKVSVLKNPNMMLYLLVYCFGSVGSAYGHIFIPACAKDRGIDDMRISYMVSVISGCDFVGRILCGFVADRAFISNTTIVSFTLFIAGLFMEFASFYTEFWTFMVFSVAHGLFAGAIFALTPDILVKLLGMENFRSAQGICIFGQGFTMGSSAPFIGYLRDVTGDYNASFQFMGASLILPAIILVLKPYIIRTKDDSQDFVIQQVTVE